MLTRRGPFGRSTPLQEHVLALLVRMDAVQREPTKNQYDVLLEIIAARLARDFVRDRLDAEEAA
jgi:hypothetical protein